APGRTWGSQRSESGGTRRLALILAAAAAVGGIVVVAAVNFWPTTPHAPTSAEPSSASTEAASSSASSSPPAPPLPRSTALTQTQLLVPVRVDGTHDIYLGDVTKNAPVRALIKRPGNDTDVSVSPDRASMIYAHDGVLQVA